MKTIAVTLLALALAFAFTACSSTPRKPESRVGAICVAEKTILLLNSSAPLSSNMAEEMMERTAGTINVNETYEVLEVQQNRDAQSGTADGPKVLRLRSVSRPTITGWAWESTIRSRLVN